MRTHQQNEKILFIYNTLLKMGFPQLSPTQASSQILEQMETYIQPSSKRLHMLEWMIESVSSRCLLASNTEEKISEMMERLWMLGVMPYSKHTKNLEYKKCVEGTLGVDNAINLLHHLADLLATKFSVSQHDLYARFSPCYKQLINNIDSLVNVNYDPYGITFPPSQYSSQPDLNQAYTQLHHSLSSHEEQPTSSQPDYQEAFSEIQTWKQTLQHRYHQLHDKISSIVQQLPPLTQFQPIQDRTLNISTQMCSTYRHYNKTLKSLQHHSHNKSQSQQHQAILTQISQLNNICY